MKKTVYLVRHGETLYNRWWRHQYNAVGLSEKGEMQAQKVAAFFADKDIDLLVSSDVVRARQTANPIAAALNKEIVYSELFRELKRPASIEGKSYLHPLSLWAMAGIYLHASHPEWRYEDAENVSDFRTRAYEALRYLEERHEHTLVVVSHRVFISSMLDVISLSGRSAGAQFLHAIFHANPIHNASITTLTFDESRGEDKWHVETVNSIAHLEK